MKTEFTIHNIECQSCVIMIESVCEDFPGVTQVKVRARQAKLLVEHNQNMSILALQEALTTAGYSVTPDKKSVHE